MEPLQDANMPWISEGDFEETLPDELNQYIRHRVTYRYIPSHPLAINLVEEIELIEYNSGDFGMRLTSNEHSYSDMCCRLRVYESQVQPYYSARMHQIELRGFDSESDGVIRSISRLGLWIDGISLIQDEMRRSINRVIASRQMAVNVVSPPSSSWLQALHVNSSFDVSEHVYLSSRFAEVLIGSFQLVLRHDGYIYLRLASNDDQYEELILAFERLQSPLSWDRHTRTSTIHATSYLPNLEPIYAFLRTAELADSGILEISGAIRLAIDSAQLRLDQYRAERNILGSHSRMDLLNAELDIQDRQYQTLTATFRPSQSTETPNIVTNANKLEGFDVDVPERLSCPITKDIMTEPVYFNVPGSSNVQCFERSAIMAYLVESKEHPITRVKVNAQMLTPNLSLKNECDIFVAEQIQIDANAGKWCNIL